MGKMGQRLSPKVREFIDARIRASKTPTYEALAKAVSRNYGVRVSKATISKRAKALNLEFRRGRKRTAPVGKKPPRSIFLECAGAFFLKGAELEMGFLATINRLLEAKIDSIQAKKALNLARRINALLLYAPIFNLKNPAEIAAYQGPGLHYLVSQKKQPVPLKKGTFLKTDEIVQYLQFLSEQKLLVPIIKEVTKTSAEALFVRIDFKKQTFFLDAQGHTVWPNADIPQSFSTTINKTIGYMKDIFQSPSVQRPLVLQICPGYTFLPQEMFNLIQCLQEAHKQPISRLVIVGKFAENLAVWQDFKPPRKCFFLAPLSSWQYARLQGTRIIREFKQYHLGPEEEAMSVADADVYLFNPQLNRNIRVRAALIRRQEERLALITNISRREERYISKIAETYFSRWPAKELKNYYDLLEQAHAQDLVHSHGVVPSYPGGHRYPEGHRRRAQAAGTGTLRGTGSQTSLSSLVMGSYKQKPADVFKIFLEQLHRYTLSQFFPSGYATEDLNSMQEKFYQQGGYLRMKRNYWEIILRSFSQKKLQEDAKFACCKFNQMGIKFADQKRLRISLQ